MCVYMCNMHMHMCMHMCMCMCMCMRFLAGGLWFHGCRCDLVFCYKCGGVLKPTAQLKRCECNGMAPYLQATLTLSPTLTQS